MANLFGNNIVTPSQKFVDEFLKLTGIYLMASNAKFYFHMASALQEIYLSNIPAMDDHLKVHHKDYDETKESMKDFVTRKFGEKGLKMFEYLIAKDFSKECESLM